MAFIIQYSIYTIIRTLLFSSINLASRAEEILFFLKIYAQMPLCLVFSRLLRRGISIFGDFLCAAASYTGLHPSHGAVISLCRYHQPLPLSSAFAAVISLCRCHQPLPLSSAFAAAINPWRCHLPCFEIFLCSYMSLSAFPTTSPTASPLRRSAIP